MVVVIALAIGVVLVICAWELLTPTSQAWSAQPSVAVLRTKARVMRLGGMSRLAYLMVGSAPLAEEVVKVAFARLLERWEGIEQPAAYLRTCRQRLQERP